MMSNDVFSTKIDWFKVNLEEFEALIEEAIAAREKYESINRQMHMCGDRTCDHPPFKKDGTPDKRYPCDHPDAVDYGTANSTLNELAYDWHGVWNALKRIGLME